MKHIVTSRDGIQFVTESDERTVPFDRALAASRTAAELEAQGDFTRVTDIDLSALVAPDPVLEKIAPELRRKQFRVIQGGKP